MAKDTPELHRQPSRALRRDAHLRRAGRRAASRSRRSTRSPGRRSAGRRARRSARSTSPGSTCSCTSRANLAERVAGGERGAFAVPPLVEALVSRGWIGEKAGQGLLQAREGAPARSEILHARPGDVDLSRAPAGALSVARAGEEHRREPARASARCFSGGTGSARSCAPRSVRRCSTRARRSRHRALHRRCRSGDALGIRLGARPVRDLPTRSACASWSRRAAATTCRRSSPSASRAARTRSGAARRAAGRAGVAALQATRRAHV